MEVWREGLELVPHHMRGAVERYIEHGISGGSFMTAVFENNLSETIGRADHINESCMRGWCEFLYWHAPSQCWGSRAKVDAWQRAGGLVGLSKTKVEDERQET